MFFLFLFLHKGYLAMSDFNEEDYLYVEPYYAKTEDSADGPLDYSP